MTEQHNTPHYFWYMSRLLPEDAHSCHYYDGQWYSAYPDDVDPHIIDKYNMRFAGIGDTTLPQTHSNSISQPTQ